MASFDFDTFAATATAATTPPQPPIPSSYHTLPSYTRPPRTYEGAFLGPRRPRQVTDYGSSLVQWMGVRRPPWKRSGSLLERERPSMSYVVDMLPPSAAQYSAVDTIPVRHLHHSVGKSKKPITVVRWTPEGRRLLTGGHTGEFMLWNGMAFNFETVMDAHYDQYKAGVTSAEWSWNRDWLISGGQKGDIKYWRPNFNNVETIDEAHHDAVRDLAWCPSDTKFLSASDDTTLKIFDFNSCQSELVLTGHGWDVKSCDWHPVKGLLVSASKDHQVKFWDPRTGRCLTTLHSHKNTVTSTRFSRVNRNLLATSSRDQTARVFDLRMMRDICVLRGNRGPISSLTWHPIHGNLISTGSEDGSLSHYLLDEPNLPPGHLPTATTTTTTAPYDTLDPANTPAQIIFPAHRIEKAHESTIWSLDWHPLGHILASGSKDTNTHFWSRARPGETAYLTDVYHIGKEAAEELGTWSPYGRHQTARREEEQEAQDEADSLVDQKRPEVIVPGIQPPPAATTQLQQASAPQMGGGGGIPGLIPGIGAPQPQPQSQPQHQPQQQQPSSSSSSLPPPPPPPLGVANIDPNRLAAMLSSGAFNNTAGAPGTNPSSSLPPPPLPDSAALMGLRPGNTGPATLPPSFPLPPPPPPPPAPAASNAHLSFPTQPPPAPGTAVAAAMIPGMMMGAGIPGLSGLGSTSSGGDQHQQQQAGEAFGGNGDGGGGGGGNGVRRRGPLPTQRDSLVEEQRRGNFRGAR